MSDSTSDQKEYLEIDSAEAKELATMGSSDLFEVVLNEVWGTWRWGPECVLVIKDVAGNYWRTYWRHQTDWEWSTFDDETVIEFESVVPREKVVVDYV